MRFVKLLDDDKWIEIGRDEALSKITQAFREPESKKRCLVPEEEAALYLSDIKQRRRLNPTAAGSLGLTGLANAATPTLSREPRDTISAFMMDLMGDTSIAIAQERAIQQGHLDYLLQSQQQQQQRLEEAPSELPQFWRQVSGQATTGSPLVEAPGISPSLRKHLMKQETRELELLSNNIHTSV